MSTTLHTRPGLTIEYLTRTEWGARTDLPRRGVIVAPDRRTEVHIHHTAAIDTSDDTPNTWDLADALGYQRRLQTVRPDLGLDIPYSFVAYLGEDNRTVWIMEGRGEDRSGAHTAGHNTVGIGFSFGGNFDIATPAADLQRAVDTIEWFARYLRTQRDMINLGTSRNPHGWQVWGHRDTKNKSCPGNHLYPLLAEVDFLGDDDMPDPRITDDEAAFLHELRNSTLAVNSNATFPQTMIPKFRTWTGVIPDLEARVESLETDTSTSGAIIAGELVRIERVE